jgi:hypothetical protein
MPNDRSIAYFAMEIALEPGMPTYGGVLGALDGDTILAAGRPSCRLCTEPSP